MAWTELWSRDPVIHMIVHQGRGRYELYSLHDTKSKSKDHHAVTSISSGHLPQPEHWHIHISPAITSREVVSGTMTAGMR